MEIGILLELLEKLNDMFPQAEITWYSDTELEKDVIKIFNKEDGFLLKIFQ